MAFIVTTLVSFNIDNGAQPLGSLIADANGDLFGTTALGGANEVGTVFEIAKTAAGYASTPTILVSFNIANGASPQGSLIADANGDLFGTTASGGANGVGTVFEIAKTAAGYASTPTTLVSFTGANGARPQGSLIADANGDLFGTTVFGSANDDGTVFEIAKTAAGYASTPTTLVSFSGANGAFPQGSLIADANGDLFGTTASGGANGSGTVFEIAKTAAGYASTPTILVSFTGANGTRPFGSLIADTNGDLFGTTELGGANRSGTVFEIAKTAAGYASTPTTLVSFTGANGENPRGSLIADANGDLFGTTEFGGANNQGTVFEIAKTAAGYASTPTILVSFNIANGASPQGSLIADVNGDLFGTTGSGGANNQGTVFEMIVAVPPTITGTVANQPVNDNATIDPFKHVTISDLNAGQTEFVTVTLSNPADGTLSDHSMTGTAAQVTADLDALVFTPTAHQVAPGQTVTTGFTIAVTDTAGETANDSTTSVVATAVATPPAITGTVANQAVHDNATIAPFAHVTVTDPNAGQTETVTVTPSQTANGTLSDPNAAADGSTITNGVYKVAGTAVAVTADLDALVFHPTAHQVAAGQTVTTGFTIAVTDTAGERASDSATSVVATASDSTTSVVTTPPAITGTVANQAVHDNATIAPFAHVTVTDPNAGQTETVTVTPSQTANGTLSDPNAATDGSTITNGVYKVAGTAAAVTADLDALVFHPTAHQVAAGQTVTTGFTIAVTDTAGERASDSATSVVATAVATAAEVNTWFQTIDGLPPTTPPINPSVAMAYVAELNATPPTATPAQIQANLENFPFNSSPPPTNSVQDTFYRTSVADFVLREFQLAWGVVPTSGSATSQYDAWIARVIDNPSNMTAGGMSHALAGTPQFMVEIGASSPTQGATLGMIDTLCANAGVAVGPGAMANVGHPIWQVLQNFAESTLVSNALAAPIANFQNLLLAGETPTGSVQLIGVNSHASLDAHIHAFV